EKTGVLVDEDGLPSGTAVSLPSRCGDTARVVEDAAPRDFIGPRGTRKMTEEIPIVAMEPATVARPKPEPDLKPPTWAQVTRLYDEALESSEKRVALEEWKRKTARYLRGFRTQADDENFVSKKIRALAGQLEQREWPVALHPSAVALVLA